MTPCQDTLLALIDASKITALALVAVLSAYLVHRRGSKG